MGFVPYGRHRKTNMRIVGQQGCPAGTAATLYCPGIAANELSCREILLHCRYLLQQWSQQLYIRLPGGACWRQLVWPAGHQILIVTLAQGAANMIYQYIGLESFGEGVGHVAHDLGDILGGEIVGTCHQQAVFKRSAALIDILVYTVLVGVQEFDVWAVGLGVQPLGVRTG